MKKILLPTIIFIILISPIIPVAAKPNAVDTDPYSLIAAVNDLRTSNGLAAYNVNPILMATAQNHAQYMSQYGVSHDEGGVTFAMRLANAGYPLGVFKSENISAGREQSVQDTVLQWQGDDLHWHTMMSPDLTEIGAGVVVVNGYAYYVIDCATPLGAKPPAANTAAPGETQLPIATRYVGPPLARTVVPSTPNAEGKIVHIVGPGETLWLIAVTYKKTLLEIRELNYMSDTDAIYPGEKLLIAKDVVVTPASIVAESATPSSPATDAGSATNTALPDLSMPTFPPFETSTPLPTLPVPADGLPTVSAPVTQQAPFAVNSTLLVVGVILLAALLLAGVLVFAGRDDK